jgi:hypothetical protein
LALGQGLQSNEWRTCPKEYSANSS